MPLTDAERYELVCEPQLKRIEDAVNTLVKVVSVGNGKPSLVSRVDALENKTEEIGHQGVQGVQGVQGKQGEQGVDGEHAQRKVVKIGPLELDGYNLKDVAVFVMLLGVAWTLITVHMEGRKRDAESVKREAIMTNMEKAAKVVLGKAQP